MGGLSSPLANKFSERADRCRQSGRPETRVRTGYFRLLVVSAKLSGLPANLSARYGIQMAIADEVVEAGLAKA